LGLKKEVLILKGNEDPGAGKAHTGKENFKSNITIRSQNRTANETCEKPKSHKGERELGRRVVRS